jgi:cell division protein ZipA
MDELRWILIVCGAVLLVGIYLWGRRSGRQAAQSNLERGRAQQFSSREPSAATADVSGDPAYDEPVQFREPQRESQVRPTSWEDIHEETATPDDVAHAAGSASEDAAWEVRARDLRRTRVEPTFNEPPVYNEASIEDDAFDPSGENVSAQEPVEHQPGEPEFEIRADARNEAPAEPAEAGERPVTAAPTLSMSDTPPVPRRIERRKIIALRLAAGTERFPGRALRQMLEGEQLQHGKYQVFHRLHTDGVSIFSVASMVEPGTFDPEKMPGSSYPGVTLFAQLPGPVPGVQALHDLVNCGKRLQESLGGVLQDDRGVPLTVHRIDRLRQEIVEFERAPAREAQRHAPP